MDIRKPINFSTEMNSSIVFYDRITTHLEIKSPAKRICFFRGLCIGNNWRGADLMGETPTNIKSLIFIFLFEKKFASFSCQKSVSSLFVNNSFVHRYLCLCVIHLFLCNRGFDSNRQKYEIKKFSISEKKNTNMKDDELKYRQTNINDKRQQLI